jgi:hypothetical protein
LDKKVEGTSLLVEDFDLKQIFQHKLAQLLREEEIKWYQREKTKDLLQVDSNTKYFHLVASGIYMKSRIFQLRDGNKVIHGDATLMKHITSYYKSLFGPPDATYVALDESQIHDIP